MKANPAIVLILLAHISSFAQLIDNPIIKAWGIERRVRGGAPPQARYPSIDRVTHRFFMETKPGLPIKISSVWIGKTAFTVIQEPATSNPSTNPTKTNNTVLQVLATDTLKKCTAPPSQLLGNEALIVYQLNGKTYYAPIKALQKTNINLP